jgi:hypothetical protein
MLAQKVLSPIVVAINNNVQRTARIEKAREMENQRVIENIKNRMTPPPPTHQRASAESLRQIIMLTEEFKDFPEELAVQTERTILGRPHSYYGYVLVPGSITDADVLRTLSYDDPQDKYFTQLTAQLELDLAWYDVRGRHVMVWSNAKTTTDVALCAIEKWLEVPLQPLLQMVRE